MMEEEGAVMGGLLVGLNVIDANLCIKGEDLDCQVSGDVFLLMCKCQLPYVIPTINSSHTSGCLVLIDIETTGSDHHPNSCSSLFRWESLTSLSI